MFVVLIKSLLGGNFGLTGMDDRYLNLRGNVALKGWLVFAAQ
jgi:hypothetical protein